MRRKDRAITGQELEAVLTTSQVVHLSMCVDNEPYVVPLTYTYHEGRLYIHSAREGKKLDILRRNPRVCFQVDCDVSVAPAERPAKACQWTMHYRSVIGMGRAEIVEDPERVRQGLEIFMQRFGDSAFEFVDKAVEKTTLILIHVQEMTGKQSPAPQAG